MDLSDRLYKYIVLFFALIVGGIHREYVSSLFENDRHFSHLSEIEREMSFRTEMGLYYYYYKVIVEAPTFTDGIVRIWHDSSSQYPKSINAQKTYNLLPEVFAGFLYHQAKKFNLLEKPECWQIERGEGLCSVRSCQGLAVPSYFYLEVVWFFAGLTGTILFLYATYLSGSIYGGLLASLAFFINHTECTRVQWTPPLRESFAYPILLYQMFSVTVILDKHRHKEQKEAFYLRKTLIKLPFINVYVPTVLSLACWQFSQFVLVTQLIAILIMQWLDIIPRFLKLQIAAVHLVAIAVNNIFGNQDAYSLYTSLAFSIFFSIEIHSRLENIINNRKLLTFIEILITINFTLLHRYICTLASDDYAHIYDILKSKLSNYNDFHTLLYTCSPEFDFLPQETYEIIIKTLLLPIAILSGFLAVYYWYRNLKVKDYPNCIEAGVFYNGLQTGAFIIMAIMIMRLKLFMNPHLCILSGLTVSKRYLENVGIKSKYFRKAFIILLLSGMSFHGIERLNDESTFFGEYSNIQQEELFNWIKLNTPNNAVFAGKMSIMANLLLSTKRPVVNNPYYESKEMRDRTLRVYEIYSRKDPATVYETLRKMEVDYVVLEEGQCYNVGSSKPGCRMIDLWDVVDGGKSKRLGKRPVCPTLFSGNPHPFRKVFSNNHYVVLRLDYSTYVELKPNVPLLLKSS